MNRKKPRRKTEPRQKKKQIRWWVLWAVAMMVALVTMPLLLARLYPGIWANLSAEWVATLIGIGLTLIVIFVLLAIGGASLGWTGFGGKKLWDWQDLLIVPVSIALIASLITVYQTIRQGEIETQRAEEAQQLEALRGERVIVQAYLEHMGMLLLEKNLRTEGENSDVRLLARARTLAVFDGVSGDRKVRVLEFLAETKLIQFGPQEQPPIISLRFANLQEAPMAKRHLLSNADLERADLYEARLANANLSNANLTGAHLGKADLHRTDLSDANLTGAWLMRTERLTEADLSNANLTGAHLYKADLTDADLSNANLTDASLKKSDLTRADLTNTDLSNEC